VFRTGDRVRLTERFEELEAGTVGYVIGLYAREVATYAVRFSGDIVKEVMRELLEPAGGIPRRGGALLCQ
jgi:hypothetical protein